MPFLAVNPQATSGSVVFCLALSLPQRDCKPNSSISYPLVFEKLTTLSRDKDFSVVLFSAQRWCGRCFLNCCITISSFHTFQSGNDGVCFHAHAGNLSLTLPAPVCSSTCQHPTPPPGVCICMYISTSFAKMELKNVFCFLQTKEGGNKKDFKET